MITSEKIFLQEMFNYRAEVGSVSSLQLNYSEAGRQGDVEGKTKVSCGLTVATHSRHGLSENSNFAHSIVAG